jgi:hypothetical protein
VADRGAYITAAALNQDATLSDRGKAFWTVLQDHYEADPALARAHVDLLRAQLESRYPRHKDDMLAIVEQLDPNPPIENLQEVLTTARRTALSRDMSIALVEGSYETFEALLGDWRVVDDLQYESESLLGTDPSDLLAVMEAGNRIPIGPAHLNAALRGGMLPGHNALIFGRPEVGKSALAISCARYAIEAGYRVGIWENEDPLTTTQLRAVQAICNATEDQVRVDGGRYRAVLERAGYFDRLYFRESPDGSIAEIEAWVEKEDLDLIIINQMVNLRTKQDNRVLELAQIARGQRALAKRQECAVIGVAQAGESAIGRSVLRLADLEWSNTGVQATLDLMIGIGVNDDQENMGQRTLHLCKNKLGGTHDVLLVEFDKQRSRIQ